jgi:TrmH RNA methyltransferase
MDSKKPGENPWQNARIKPAQEKPRRPAPFRPPVRHDQPPPPRPARMPRGPVSISTTPEPVDPAPRLDRAPRRNTDEVRIYGRNACLAAFARRPDDVRKVYLTEARIADFKAVLAWCVKRRLGYRVVENDDLDRLTETQHHEGVCFEVRRRAALPVAELLRACPAQKPALLVWLDGVGNPHNVGAILRSAANFGVAGMILPARAPDLPGATLRVAEGGAESVRLAHARAGEDVAAALRGAGFRIVATVPRDGAPLYKNPLPQRLALVLGAEGEGMSKELIAAADMRLTVPGTGAVESLNVAASAAVLFAEFWRQHNP